MKKVAIVVVTYNRKEMLKKCIQALLEQSYTNYEIIIVDNASTDGTHEYIEETLKNSKVTYINTTENLGGAGGFNFGIKKAIQNTDANYIWLMDDDCIAKKDSLEELINASQTLNENYGFLSSVVLWKDNTTCEMNKQKIKQPWHKKASYLQYGLLPTYHATFVSFFIKRQTVIEEGLPIKEFFIWGDDVEYSNRISKKQDSYIVGRSIVVHETKNNEGSNIAKDDIERIGRYKYAYRNEMYIAKKNKAKGIIRQICKIALHIGRIIKYSKKYKIRKIIIVLVNSIKGIWFNPKIEYIK